MELNSYPDLSPEYFNAHKIAAKELAKYCQEFDRWRTAERRSAGLAQDPRRVSRRESASGPARGSRAAWESITGRHPSTRK